MKVYIAGFDVFAADADVRRIRAIEACRARGLVPLHPFDNEVQTARDIYEGNVALIREADVVVANLNPFRGLASPMQARPSRWVSPALSTSLSGHMPTRFLPCVSAWAGSTRAATMSRTSTCP